VLEKCFEAPTAEERGELFQQQGVLQVFACHIEYSSRWNPKNERLILEWFVFCQRGRMRAVERIKTTTHFVLYT
jgi:hypothetical protein